MTHANPTSHVTRGWALVDRHGRFRGVYLDLRTADEEKWNLEEELNAAGRFHAGGGPLTIVPVIISEVNPTAPKGRAQLTLIPGGAGEKRRKKNPTDFGPFKSSADAQRWADQMNRGGGKHWRVEGVRCGEYWATTRRDNPAPSYEGAHWGESGHGRTSTMTVPNPDAGPLVELGEVVEIVYRTVKAGDTGPTEYIHKFKRTRPRLIFNQDGKLLLAGGSYRVTERGIVG